MSDTAIRVENLGKRYRIGVRQPRYRTLRDSLTDALASPFRRLRSPFQRSNVATLQRSNDDYIWALKDVSLEVNQGEVVGIIGGNGAGKTTLLKILSRITEPTQGQAEVHGRVGSLLEVGTGFHPELTGRENIYLNGAILGMKKAEIARKFDEIVGFAEVERFLDTPVKHFSSGMYVRLAFAVAAHLDPEILLVDEVLAVGDAQFQKKCLGKMGDVAASGRTVLFVSHNMHAIRRLCVRALLFERGRCVLDDQPGQAVDSYLNDSNGEVHGPATRRGDEEQRGKVAYITSWGLEGSPAGAQAARPGDPLRFLISLTVLQPVRGAFLGIAIWAEDGTLVWAANSHDGEQATYDLRSGEYQARFSVTSFPVRPGRYGVEISVNTLDSQLDHWHSMPYLTILHRGTTVLSEEWRGLVNVKHTFGVQRVESGTDRE